MLPLDGITVVSLEHAVAAPFCTRQLADYGARVIKVERPGSGDFARGYDETVLGMSSHFVWLNRGKESLTLDLKQAAALAVLEKLIKTADVLVQNLAPGAASRMGLDYATLAEKHPRLIVADISGYGDNGPYRDKKAYDILIQAEAGLVGITGGPTEPARCGVSVADIAAGMYAYSGILTALIQRGKTGRGTRVEVSMLEALGEWMGYALNFGHYGGKAPGRNGAAHPAIAPYGPHRAGDGGEVIFGLQNEREWTIFCGEVLGQAELAGDERFASNSRRVANRAVLTGLIEAALAGMSCAQVVDKLDAAGIASGRMNDIEDVWNHPQLKARGRWRDIGSSAGTIQALLPPANLEGIAPSMGDIPAVGQHTEQLLSELGYGTGEISAMRGSGAI
ncbi:MAG: CaiB/BaiF CoA-transferase family protein [Proteobacteria bacterium]|nr:CaiB/BaiF CoA-transferase family protein [Pseudomonadota bacterium]